MILLTGGSGLLGTELRKYIECYAPSRNEVDITNPNWEFWLIKNISLIIHCGAFTDLLRAEKEKKLCYDTNVVGTRNIASLGIPMIYISTEYVFDGTKGNYDESDYPNPQNFYALTKLLGEYESRRSPKSVVIRCLFKPRPFKHDVGCADQFTSGDYVDVLAKEIALAVKLFDKLPPTLHIGSERKTTFELARRTREVGQTTTEEVFKKTGLKLPKDTSLNCSLWERIKREN